MNDSLCQKVVASLLRYIESGTPMSDGERSHLKECEECRSILNGARELQRLDSTPADSDNSDETRNAAIAAAEAELRAARRRRALTVIVTAALLAVPIVPAIITFPNASPERYFGALGLAAAIIGVLALILVVPVMLVGGVRSPNTSGQRLYRRLGPGRQLGGVCLGIAEHNGWNVSIVRLVFVVLFFMKGIGLLLYLLLELTIPAHPADRQYLLRFQLRRLWARLRGRAHIEET